MLDDTHYYLAHFKIGTPSQQVYNIISYIIFAIKEQEYIFSLDIEHQAVGYLRHRKKQNSIEFVCAIKNENGKYDKELQEEFMFNGVKIKLLKHSKDSSCTRFCKLYKGIKLSLAIISEKYILGTTEKITRIKEFPGLYLVLEKKKLICNSLRLDDKNVLLFPIGVVSCPD